MRKNILFLCLFAAATQLYAQIENSVVINEFLASNDSTAADPNGEFDDWIELYNLSDIEVNLSDFFLSDDAEELGKWSFPEGVLIPEGGYLIIWADDDEEQEGLHANFKLSAGGESVILSDQDTVVIDSISYPEQSTDTAFARLPNGTGDFVFQAPTFAANNDNAVKVRRYAFLADQLSIFPNPATEHINLKLLQARGEDIRFDLFNATGQLIKSGQIAQGTVSQSLAVDGLISGNYFLRLTDGRAVEMRKVTINSKE